MWNIKVQVLKIDFDKSDPLSIFNFTTLVYASKQTIVYFTLRLA